MSVILFLLRHTINQTDFVYLIESYSRRALRRPRKMHVRHFRHLSAIVSQISVPLSIDEFPRIGGAKVTDELIPNYRLEYLCPAHNYWNNFAAS